MMHRGLFWRVRSRTILRNQFQFHFRVVGGGFVLLLLHLLDVGSKTAGVRWTGTTGTILTMIVAVVALCCAFVQAAFVAARIPRTPS